MTDDNVVDVLLTRSDGADGAVIVFIDTPFEPDGSDGGPGLRVIVNDDTVYTGKEHQPTADGKARKAPEYTFTVPVADLAYRDDRFDEAAARFLRAKEEFSRELDRHISAMVLQTFPTATEMPVSGWQDHEGVKVRVQQVRAGKKVLFNIEDGEFDNLDDIDSHLSWLGSLNPEDYLGDGNTFFIEKNE